MHFPPLTALPRPSRVIKRGVLSVRRVHQFGMEKRVDLDVLSLAFEQIATRIYANHPSARDRLEAIHHKKFLISVTEYPFDALVTLLPDRVKVDCNLRYNTEADVYIEGDYQSLIQVFEGDEDGDSLFFSRKISVKGEIETLVTMRNAIDNEDINLVDEIATLFGPLEQPAKSAIQFIQARREKHRERHSGRTIIA